MQGCWLRGSILQNIVLLKKELLKIVTIKYACHSVHLCSAKACSKLPSAMKDTIWNVCSHFSCSLKRANEFISFQM